MCGGFIRGWFFLYLSSLLNIALNTMAEWFTRPLSILVPSAMWYGAGRDVHLTFDDGPHPIATPIILAMLRQRDIRATFFLIGPNIDRYPEIAASIREEGHTIGNHTFSHRPVWFRESGEVRTEIRRCSESMTNAGIQLPTLFRPPYGRLDPATTSHARAEGCRTVMFGVNTWDFSRPAPSRIVERTLRLTRPGDIIVFHDNDATADRLESYLPATLDGLLSRQMSFSPL